MPWVEYMDVLKGHTVVEVEGNVLEVFTTRSATTDRIHLRLLAFQIEEPDKRGHVRITARCSPDGRGGGFTLLADQAGFAALQPLIQLAIARQRGEA